MAKNIPCALCGGENLQIINKFGVTGKGTPLSRFDNCICRDCGLVFINPQPETADYKNFYKENEKHRHNFQDAGDVLKQVEEPDGGKGDAVVVAVRPYAPEGGSILDIGSGFGVIANAFKRSGYAVFGVEPSGLQAKYIAEKSGIEMFCGDFDEFYKANAKKFSCLVLHHVFEHFTDPAEKLRQFKDILAPGGAVYIEVPDVSWFAKPVNRFFDYGHPYSYSPKTMKDLLHKNGWKIIGVNKEKKRRLQIIIAPDGGNHQDFGSDAYFERGGYRYTVNFIRKRRAVDFFRRVISFLKK
jgi:SAM-dependent methyltransferase